MSVAIGLGGSVWYVSGMSVQEARQAIASGEELKVWWFAGNGQRYTETMWMPEDRVEFIRSESDD